MHRNTYIEVNLKNIESNVKKIINHCKDYDYYFGVVKADSYGHYDIRTINSIIKGGCNYLAVATLDEALEIRKYNKKIPILCLGVIPMQYIEECEKNNITLTISSIEYLNSIDINLLKKIKIHIKINSGMNRLGIKNKQELLTIYNKLINNNILIEGIYTHIYDSKNIERTDNQLKIFKDMLCDIGPIPIIHVYASDAILKYKKLDIANGCRLGISMYGISDILKLKSTFKLISEVIQINELENETLGYGGEYKVTSKEKIAVVSIGYADGIIRKNTGRFVYINNKKYPIVGNICMDMLFIKVDNSVSLFDKVEIIKDVEHLIYTANYLDTIPYEVLCCISKRVQRLYIKK